jgi:hypothetical protein
MSIYSKELPKTVSSVNGKNNAVTIESSDSSIVVDNSQQGKIRLSSNGASPSGNYVEWTGVTGNSLQHPTISMTATSFNPGNNIELYSFYSMSITADKRMNVTGRTDMILEAMGGNVKIRSSTNVIEFNGVNMQIDANGITFSDMYNGYQPIVLKWGFIGSS